MRNAPGPPVMSAIYSGLNGEKQTREELPENGCRYVRKVFRGYGEISFAIASLLGLHQRSAFLYQNCTETLHFVHFVRFRAL